MKILNQRADLVLGFAAQALQYGASLMLLPFITIKLSAEEVGLWYVFMTVQGLVMLLDFGFQPTFTRNFSLAFSGVKSLYKEGVNSDTLTVANFELIAKIQNAARVLYLSISVLVFLSLLSIGSWYILSLVSETNVLENEIIFSWALFSLAVSLSLYFLWLSPLMIGTDDVQKNYQYLIISRGGFAALGILLLSFDYGLLALAFSLLFSVVFARVCAGFLIRNTLRKIREQRVTWAEVWPVLTTVWYNSSRMGLVSLGAFLITRYNVFVVSSFMGLKVAGSYAITLQILSAINSIAQLPFQVKLPKIVKARVSEDRDFIWSLFVKYSVFFVCVFLVGVLIVFFAGHALFEIVGSNVFFLSGHLFLIFSVIMMLEGNHTNSAFLITTSNKVPFVIPALVSGLSIAFLSTLSAKAGFGILGIICSQGVVQLAYNNWKWPLYFYKEIKTD